MLLLSEIPVIITDRQLFSFLIYSLFLVVAISFRLRCNGLKRHKLFRLSYASTFFLFLWIGAIVDSFLYDRTLYTNFIRLTGLMSTIMVLAQSIYYTKKIYNKNI